MTAVRLTRTLVLVAVGAYVVSLIPGVRASPGFSTFWDVAVYTLVGWGAAAVCLLRTRISPVDRVAWTCIGVG